MTQVKLWMAPALALAVAAAVGGYANRAAAQNQQAEKKQPEQSSSKESTSSGQAGSQTQSGSSTQPASSQSNQQSNQQSSSAQSNANKSADKDAKAAQPQQDQSQSNQRTQAGQAGANTQGQAGANTRSNQTGQNANQANKQADKQGDKQGNQSRDNNKSRTNISVGIQFGNVNDRGLVINTVERNSFFYTAGIRQGDVIISIQGRPLRTHTEFIEFVSTHPGERIPVIVLRDGREETVQITYDENLVPPQQPGGGNDQAALLLGVTLDGQIPQAAVVREVVPGGPAAAAGLKPGDEIIMINGQRVSGIQGVSEIVGKMRPGDKVELDYLQLKHVQITLAAGGTRTASATAEVGANQGVQQTNYQENAQGQNREAQGTQPSGRSSTPNSGNRGGVVPRVRN